MLVAAVLVVGWLAGGLVSGTWAPGDKAASVSGGPVTLAEAPAPRSKPARVPGRRLQVEPRAHVVRAEARRPRPRRRPATAKPPVVAPAPTAAAAPASAVSQVSYGSPPDTSGRPKPESAKVKPKKTQLSATPAARSSAGADVKPSHGFRGNGHGHGQGAQPTPLPAPSVGEDKHADKGDGGRSGR
jgi:hypothetical protein